MRFLSYALLAFVGFASQKQQPVRTLAERDGEVYAVVLDSIFATSRDRIDQLVVDDSAYNLPRTRLVLRVIDDFYSFPGVDSVTVRSFDERNLRSLTIRHIGDLASRIPVILVSYSTLQSLPRDIEHYWRKFYQLYPKSAGLISLSPIGYNASGDVAILMVDRSCGGLCGNGYSVSLRWKDGKWSITKVQRTWVS